MVISCYISFIRYVDTSDQTMKLCDAMVVYDIHIHLYVYIYINHSKNMFCKK